jgi:tetratricopeptide (TPR) repeat protein
LKAIAHDNDVDIALSGTILRAGEQLRVSAQLVAVPGGTVTWSYSSQVAVGDVFGLQDYLSRGIVESLALTLSEKERLAMGHDVPRSAKAFEFYLRANQLSRDLGSIDVARDLYLQCLNADPEYAPAWAQIGRVYRIIAKYRGDKDSMTRAESALHRALELNPLLAIADRFYAEAEIDNGQALDGMVRLVRRASSQSNDPELYAALVSLCRYCGLQQASLAAHERARRLDGHVPTSLMHTLIQLGKYQRAAEEIDSHQPGAWIPMSLSGHTNAPQQCRVDAESARSLKLAWVGTLIDAWADMLEGRGNPEAFCSAVETTFLLPPDLDAWFYSVLGLSRFGGKRGEELAIKTLAFLVGRGFVPYDMLLRHSFLEPVRHRTEFVEILEQAKKRYREGQRAFLQAGGEAVLGTGTAGAQV